MLSSTPTGLFIGGEHTAAQQDGLFETINPANYDVLAEVSAGTEADVDRAVAAARAAFKEGAWRKLDPRSGCR